MWRLPRLLTSAGTAIALVATTGIADAAPGASDAARTHMRGDRYCELLLLQPADGRLEAQVWNTYGLNDCPEQQWATLDPAAVARDEGVAVVLRNGPRYWLIDEATRSEATVPPVRSLGGIPMRRLGAVSLAPADVTAGAYRPQRVVRNAQMTWPAARRVYELTAPDGAVYIMQSWSRQIDPTLAERDLRRLGTRLALPEGWSFSSRVPRRPIRVGTDADGAATVLQDELMNAYSRRA